MKDLFSANAERYARHRPKYPPQLAALLADAAPARALAVDCGCGSGQLSVLLAEHFGQVLALDASAAQLAHATAHPRVTYVVAAAEQVPLPPGSADLVVAAQAAHWFDLPRFWREVERVARPGALVALASYGLLEIDPQIDRLIHELHDTTLAAYWPPERWLVVNGYSAIELPYTGVALPSPPDIDLHWSMNDLLEYLKTWSAVTVAERATGRSPLPDFVPRLRRAWGDPEQTRAVRWPIVVRAGRVPPERAQ
ncbi:MAG TPA: class I SAM-dependent methyltransferase [Burkholderiaceae bacterium]|jgi:SAM-dependent methyltransferase|nr:class I SAM-dependent methyltransferase [Burkholderiaceae bacterium]